ncbi:MAG: efflux RND transporter periplasmic adaptor subunit [Bacteroidota bacterium]|jgi:HlyD family secretion protein
MKNAFVLIFAGLSLVSCNNSMPEADAYGNFESTPIYITPETGGKILAVVVDEGDRVKTGQLVALLDSSEIVIRQEQVVHQIEAANASISANQAQAAVYDQQITNLEIDRNRLEKLLADGSATQKQYDDVVAAISLAQKQKAALLKQNDRLQAEIAAQKSQIDLMQLNVNRCRVLAPCDGRILNLYQRAGELAAPGKPLMRIANTDTLYLRAFASGDQLPIIQIGQQVTVRVDDEAGQLKTIAGTITWISQEAEFTPKTIQTRRERVNLVYAFKVKVLNDGSLNIGMPGEVFFPKNK